MTALMTVLWVIGGIVTWLTIAIIIGRVWLRINPREDRDVLTIFSLSWPIMVPLLIFLSPIIIGAWAINRPTKAERLKQKAEDEEWEASKRARQIAQLVRELDL